MKRRTLLGLAAATAALATTNSLAADAIRHFVNGTAPGQFPSVTNVLTLSGIGASSVSSENTAETFIVPGSGFANLTFGFLFDEGTFNYSFGYYRTSLVSANPMTDKLGYATQALAAGNGVLVFDDITAIPGDAAFIPSIPRGVELGFFLIPNNTLAAFRANPGSFFPSQTSNNALRSPLFSVANANPAQFDQMLSFVGNNSTMFTWEDLTRTLIQPGSDSFADMAFTVNVELIPVVPEPSAMVIAAPFLAIGVALTRRFANLGRLPA